MSRLVTKLAAAGAAVAAATVGLATPAAAAPGTLAAPQYMVVDRYSPTWSTFGFWTVAGAHHYDMIISAGGSSRIVTVPGRASDPTGRFVDYDITLDPCVTYLVSVGARTASGQGGTTGRRLEPALRPGGIRAASVTRGADPTTATFSWTPPAVRGYAQRPGGWAHDKNDKVVAPLTYETELVRTSDNTVVKTTKIVTGTSTDRVSFTANGLDPKRAYVLRVKTANDFGSCADKTGRILLTRTA